MDASIDLSSDYNFKRISKIGETNWEDVLQRFIDEMVNRKCSTSRKDLEWLLLNYYALPNSPALVTAGSDFFSASACSSYPIYDSISDHKFSILGSLGIGVKALKAGIGVGWNFSQIRAKEESVKGKFHVSEGPVGFLRSYDGFVGSISQLTRKAACMGLLHVNHPNIEDFIDLKVKDGEVKNFNISVVLDDKFMKAALAGVEYNQYWRKEDGIVSVDASTLLNKICERAWENGEPGIVFEDHIKRDYFEDMGNPVKLLMNPCAEALLSWDEDWLELCVLATINLPRYLKLSETDRKRVLDITVSMLDDVIEVQDYVCEEHRKGMKERNRKIGIGIAGLATELAKKGIVYGSGESYNFTLNVFKELGEYSLESSKKLGEVNGLERKNSSLISQAPTSTLSRIFDQVNEEGCSYGIEPYFGMQEVITTNSFGTFKSKEKIIDYLHGETSHIKCANDLTYKEHLVPVKAYYNANPKGITQGCSKTINFRNNVTVEEIREAIIYCWENKIKAISFYRDGSRKNQTISVKDSYKEERPTKIEYRDAPRRMESLECDIYRVQSKNQRWMIFVGLLNDNVYEVFMGSEEKIRIPVKYEHGVIRKEKGKYNLVVGTGDDELIIVDIPGTFESKEHSTLSRLISMSLRHGTPLKFCVEQLLKDGGFDAINRAVGRVLKKYIKENEEVQKGCPMCKKPLIYIQGCPTCIACNWSKCS